MLLYIIEEIFDKIKEILNAPDSDIFDVLTFIAYSENLQTRQERVDNHKVAIFNNIQSRQHAFIEFVLKQYIQNGKTQDANLRLIWDEFDENKLQKWI